MISPFPGMDPYLEDRSIWRGLHTLLITSAAAILQPLLVGRGYHVSVECRIWLDDPERPIYPDVVIWERVTRQARPEARGATLVADPPTLLRIPRLENKERYLEIRQLGSKKLVTGIEVISPSNKSHRKSRTLYIRKRRELRAGKVSLVEIDLLRLGKSLAAVPSYAIPAKGKDSYVVNVIRPGSQYFEFYPISLPDRLPRLGIPLLKGESDVVLDLQTALDRAYLEGAFWTEIDYSKEPTPNLSADNAAWADAMLTEKGLRPLRT
jgi:hypothetical protein